MDDRQYQAAIRAERQLHMADLQKRYALMSRNDCIRDCKQFHIPYRVLYNLHRDQQEIVLPNPYYPASGASPELQEAYLTLDALENGSLARTKARIQRLTSISEQDKAEMLASSRERFRRDPEEVRAQIRILEAKEVLPTDQYDYYFTVFLQSEDFSQYRNYDWTGDIIPAEQAESLRNGYLARQKAFLEHPEQFAGYFYTVDKIRPESTKFEPPIPEF